MPGLVELAYTTAGGIVGAAVTNYLAHHQDRRELRAAVMRRLQQVRAVRAGVADIVPVRSVLPGPYAAGDRTPVTERFRLTAVLGDDRNAERAHRAAIDDLVVAALAAGVPRRVLDFAGGAEERALQCEIIRRIDHHLDGVLGPSLTGLMESAEAYREATAQLLLRSLWHPWLTRWRVHRTVRGLRRDVAELHRLQESAMSVLTRPEHTAVLAERLGSAG